MTESTRAKASRRPRRSASQLFIAALVVFGIAASVLLLFSENIQWLRVGLVSALWAAIVGAFAMTKYRREAVADQTRAKDLQTVYELQLAREISARREYELGVEARVRGEVQIETSEIAALRAELAHLRTNLQVLFDGNLPTERVALRAEATRVQELGGRNYSGYQPAPSGLYVRGGAPQSQYSQDGPNAAVPGLATPYDEPVTAETSVLYPESPIGSGDTPPSATTDHVPGPPREAPSRRSVPGGGRRAPTPPRADPPTPPLVNEPVAYSYGGQASTSTAVPSEDSASTDSVLDVEEVTADDLVDPVQSVESVQPAEPENTVTPETVEPETAEPVDVRAPVEPHNGSEAGSPNSWDLSATETRRRRRAEPDADGSGAHSNGRSVADIMAGLQSSSTEPSARRHRRRAD